MFKRIPIYIRILALFGAVLTIVGLGLLFKTEAPIATVIPSNATILPAIPVKGCRGEKAKRYDECGSQLAIFRDALSEAQVEGKILIVSYGAEWCIWCHVFDAYVRGEYGKFKHTYSDSDDQERYTSNFYEKAKSDPSEAAANLARFFETNFVLVHIEDRYARDGYDVLVSTGAIDTFYGGLPHIFTVNNSGNIATVFDWEKVEIRRDTLNWYRGYDRELLTEELNRMIQAAK